MEYLNIYSTLPIQVKRADKVYLYDIKNRRYLDMVSGLGVNLLGYGDSDIDRCLSGSKLLPHISNLYLHPVKEKIAEYLNELCCTDSVFFVNSGTEASEAALKFAWKTSPGKVLAFENSFHGRTSGSLSLSHLFLHQDFPRIDVPVDFVKWNQPEDLRKKGEKASIIIFEPIQGAGGVRPLNEECFNVLKDFQRQGKIIIADEIQSGLGRTGRFLASSFFGLKPDIVTLAKGLGGGLPLGAICLRERIRKNLKRGDHGTTMGGNLKALELAGIVLEKVESKLMKHIKNLEDKVVSKFKDELGLRGRGLFLGFDVDDGRSFFDEMLEKGYIVNIIRKNTVRLLPPYIITENQLEEFFNTVRRLI